MFLFCFPVAISLKCKVCMNIQFAILGPVFNTIESLHQMIQGRHVLGYLGHVLSTVQLLIYLCKLTFFDTEVFIFEFIKVSSKLNPFFDQQSPDITCKQQYNKNQEHQTNSCTHIFKISIIRRLSSKTWTSNHH